MSSLFGINIPRLLRTSIRAAGGLQNGTLTKVTHGALNTADYAAGRARTLTNYSFEGFIDDENRQDKGILDQQNAATFQGTRRVTMLGDSLPSGVVPRPNDSVTIGGRTYLVADEGVKTDPVEAVFICTVRGGV